MCIDRLIKMCNFVLKQTNLFKKAAGVFLPVFSIEAIF